MLLAGLDPARRRVLVSKLAFRAAKEVEVSADDGPRCRRCGCTDADGCPGGCYWVHDPEGGDLCNQCLDNQWFAMRRNHAQLLSIRRDLDQIMDALGVARARMLCRVAKPQWKRGTP